MRVMACKPNINEQNAPNDVMLPEGQGDLNDEERAFENGM